MEYKIAKIMTLLRVLAFLAGLGLVIWGQARISYERLAYMMLGLLLMLAVLFDYNRRKQ